MQYRNNVLNFLAGMAAVLCLSQCGGAGRPPKAPETPTAPEAPQAPDAPRAPYTPTAPITKATPTKSLIEPLADFAVRNQCGNFATIDECNDGRNVKGVLCVFDNQSDVCREKIEQPAPLHARCEDYSAAECNSNQDQNRNNCAVLPASDECSAVVVDIPPPSHQGRCKAFTTEHECNAGIDVQGRACEWHVADKKCKKKPQVVAVRPPEIKADFAYQTLKAWTDEALKWDEAFVSGARPQNEEAKIPLDEFKKSVMAFAKRAAESNMKSQDSWVNGILPQNAEFFDLTSLGKEGADPYYDQDFFAEKKTLPPKSHIIVMGDFHGSLHSLIRNLWRLHAFGYLSNDFTLDSPDTHMVFTGDFIDRGRYSTEVLYTLLRLKLANFDNVHLLRGNHEDKTIASQYGFEGELARKYGDDGSSIFDDTMAVVRFLPMVFFLSLPAGDTGDKINLHFSHGGFDYDLENQSFDQAYSPRPLLLATAPIAYDLIDVGKHLGFQWSDFEQQDKSSESSRGFLARERVATLGLDTLKEYLDNNGIHALFRGHQDMEFGLKMLFKFPLSPDDQSEAQQHTVQYDNGPYHWMDVVKDPAKVKVAATSGLVIDDYAPVYTFTTASEARKMLYDAFGIIETADDFKDYRLKVHEVAIDPSVSNEYVFVNLSPAEENDHGIHVKWHLEGPGLCLINP